MPLLFPDVDMPTTVGAAFGADPAADPLTWSFTDLSSRLLDVPMVKRVGRAGGAKQTDTKSLALTLDNDDGELTPLNPLSTHWPHIVLDPPVPMVVEIDPLDTGGTTWFEGFVASWQPDIIATTEGTTAVIRITLAGVLRHLSQGAKPLRSPLFRSMSGVAPGDYVPHAYYPCEDGAGAAWFESGLSGGLPMTYKGTVTLASDDTLPGSEPLPVFASGAWATVTIPPYTDTGNWVVQMVTKMTSTTTVFEITTDGTGRKARLKFDFTGTLTFEIFNAAGASAFLYSTPLVAADITGRWISVAIGEDTFGGGSFEGSYQVLGTNAINVFGGDPIVGLYGRITSVRMLASTSGNTPAGHLGIYVDSAFDISGDTYYNAQAAMAWTNESDTDRLERLAREHRVSIDITGTSGVMMGPQGNGTFLEECRECEKVGGGVLGESGYGLSYITLSERYNRPPDLTIDLATYAVTKGQGRAVFTPILDDGRYRNEWTINRPDGISVIADDTNVTKWQDSDEVNVYSDDQVADQAWWRYYRDSITAYRWPGTPVDLAANPDLIGDWLTLTPGLSKMRRENPPAQHPAGDIDEMLDGWTETIGRRQWIAAVSGSPAQPYDVAELDDDVYAKLDTEGSELHSAATSSATTLEVATTSGDLWSTDDAEVPWDWWVDGERATVTDVAASLVTYGAVGTATHGNNASVVPGLPGSLAAGNLMVLFAAIRNSGTGVPVAPAGWTRWPVFDAAANTQVFARIAGASEAAPTVTFTGGAANADTSAQIIRLDGKWHSADFALLAHASALNISAQNISYPGLSLPSADNCLILYLGWKQDDWTSVATIAGATEIAEATTTTGDDQGIVWDYVIQTTAASIAPGAFTVTGGGSAISRGAVVAVRCDYQTATVTRAVGGLGKAQGAGAEVRLWTAWRYPL